MSRKRTNRITASSSVSETIKIIDGKDNIITSFSLPKGKGVTLHFAQEDPTATPASKLKRDAFAYFNATLTAIEDLSEIDVAAAEDTAEALGLLDCFEEI